MTPRQPLPPYEEIVLGGLGKLADNLLVVERLSDDAFEIIRCGRGLCDWIGIDACRKITDELGREFSAPVKNVLLQALSDGRPVVQHGRRVRGGMVETFEFLAMPLSCRWGKTLLAVHITRVGAPFNLVDTIFRATEEGILALAAVRDAGGHPVDFQIVAFNAGVTRILNRPDDDLHWRYLSQFKDVLDTPRMRRHLTMALETGQNQQFEISVSRNGEECHFSVGIAAAGDLISATFTDVTDIRQRENSFRLLFEGNPMPMWLYDPETLSLFSVNDSAVTHYGYSRTQFLSMPMPDLWAPDERELHRVVAQSVGNSYFSDRTWRHLRSDGSEIEVLTYARRVTFADKPAILVAVVDVTERKQAEARIAYLAHHDALTGLANRTLFNEHLRDALAKVRRNQGLLAIHCIDLDHFKSVNDTLGHPVGDQLLREVATRLQEQIGKDDVVARLGGDEFAIIQSEIAGPNEANALAAKVIAAVSARFDIQGHEVVVGASVGIALAPNDGETSETLLRNADMALYRAKADGRGTSHFFEPEMDRLIQARRLLELDLRKAFVNGEFELFYQPLITLSDNTISGFEALLRWRSPKRGMVAPGEFIPLAEEIGLIEPLGEWVLREACQQAARWPGHLRLAVNLSPAQFRNRGVVKSVVSALGYSGLSPNRLELEITESVLLADTETNLSILHQLREIGVRISMDDFGTGYSSLSYLRSFPFDKIKIDRSFVSDLAQRPDCMAIIHAIVGLGASLGISTTAEGVETTEQLERLRAEGCTEAQGFLFSPPRPASEFGDLAMSPPLRAAVA